MEILDHGKLREAAQGILSPAPMHARVATLKEPGYEGLTPKPGGYEGLMPKPGPVDRPYTDSPLSGVSLATSVRTSLDLNNDRPLLAHEPRRGQVFKSLKVEIGFGFAMAMTQLLSVIRHTRGSRCLTNATMSRSI